MLQVLKKSVKYDAPLGVSLTVAFFITVAILTIFGIGIIAPEVATARIIDDKIIMYKEENVVIEQYIDRIVQEYLKHEQNTFTDTKTDQNSITSVTLFPELSSDTFIQQQLEIYVENSEKIKNLRERKIDMATLRWLLYFGQ